MTITYTPKMGRTKKVLSVIWCKVAYIPKDDWYCVYGLRRTPGGEEKPFYHYSEMEPLVVEEALSK